MKNLEEFFNDLLNDSSDVCMHKKLFIPIDELNENERLVITLYYYEKLTLKEIGKVLEISESRVSQIHSKAIIKLRSKLMTSFGDYGDIF